MWKWEKFSSFQGFSEWFSSSFEAQALATSDLSLGTRKTLLLPRIITQISRVLPRLIKDEWCGNIDCWFVVECSSRSLSAGGSKFRAISSSFPPLLDLICDSNPPQPPWASLPNFQSYQAWSAAEVLRRFTTFRSIDNIWTRMRHWWVVKVDGRSTAV
jgi:hypothetical protein